MRDAAPRLGPLRPWMARPFKGYLILLAASNTAILAGVGFGIDLLSPTQREERVTLWVVVCGLLAGVTVLCSVVGALLRQVATLSREIEWLKEQSPNKPVNTPQDAEAPRA